MVGIWDELILPINNLVDDNFFHEVEAKPKIEKGQPEN